MIFTHFGDNCLIEKKNTPIDVSALGFFDSLEFDCWLLIKKYADAFGIKITGFESDDDNDVSWDLAKEVQETILNIFEDSGIKFIKEADGKENFQ